MLFSVSYNLFLTIDYLKHSLYCLKGIWSSFPSDRRHITPLCGLEITTVNPVTFFCFPNQWWRHIITLTLLIYQQSMMEYTLERGAHVKPAGLIYRELSKH